MSPRIARFVALPFALAAFALRLVDTLWITSFTFQIPSVIVGLLLSLTGLFASFVIPWAVYMLITRRARVRPVSLQVDSINHRFVVPATPNWSGPQAIVLGWGASGLVLTERVPNEDRMRLVEWGYPKIWMGLALLALTTIGVRAASNRPFLTLDPEAITVHGLVKRMRIGWDEIQPGRPSRPVKRNARFIVIYQARRSTAGAPRSPRKHLLQFHVDPSFLVSVIRDYVDRPGHRSTMGTDAELARLQAAFNADPSAPS